MASHPGGILDRSLYDGKLQTPEFYERIGFRCGLEVHQQLLTERKLFCHCPARVYSEDHDVAVLRHMRPTLSELGEYDGTALMEFKTRKEVLYLLDSSSVCTYEMDDTPPFEPNPEAIRIAIEIALLLGCRTVGEVHVSRKQYLDGSIPTGFQRTAIIGVEGSIPFEGREIGIYQLALEEDSCREVEDAGHRITFRTDRLSMPLVEVVTKPGILNPMEAARVGRQIGRLLRCTSLVRRGLGSVRQDVNVSVTGGTRIEIKGVPRIPLFPSLTHNEALRQMGLLGIRDWLHGQGITDAGLDGRSADVTRILAGTLCPGILHAIEEGHCIRAMVLRGFQPALLEEIQPGIRFAQEFSGRIRVIACLDQSSNLYVRGDDLGFGLHRHARVRAGGGQDEPGDVEQSLLPGLEPAFAEQQAVMRDPEHGPTPAEWAAIAAELKAGPEDGLLLFFGPERDVATAEAEILIRAREALGEIPNETRQPFPYGTTDFERILPGPDRMYPDTDLPPIALQEELVQSIAANLPELPWTRAERYVAMGLGPVAVDQLLDSPFSEPFDLVVAQTGLDPKSGHRLFACEAPAAMRRGHAVASIPEAVWLELARAWAAGDFYREALPALLPKLAAECAAIHSGNGGDADPDPDPGPGPGPDGDRARAILHKALQALELNPGIPESDLVAEAQEFAVASACAYCGKIRRGDRRAKCERVLTGALRAGYGGLIAGRELRKIATDAVSAAFGRDRAGVERSKA